ncbi:MAG TPA: cytochrome c, partial [Bacteroidia bacterium]|nr:cytochrome c [Bacteroidia bacterium]
MKKFLKIIGLLILIAVVAIGGFASFIAIRGIPKYEVNVPPVPKVEVTPERVARGAKIASMLCQNCHLSKETNMLTGLHMVEIPEFGNINTKNITNDPDAGI